MSHDPYFDPQQHKYYQQPQYYQQSPILPSNGLAITSLVFGILCWFPLWIIGALIAIITGHIAVGQIRESNGTQGGLGMARAGMISGYIQLVITLLVALAITLFVYMGYHALQSVAKDGIRIEPPDASVEVNEQPGQVKIQFGKSKIQVESGSQVKSFPPPDEMKPVDIDIPKSGPLPKQDNLPPVDVNIPKPPEFPKPPELPKS